MSESGSQVERMRRLLDAPLADVVRGAPATHPETAVIAMWDLPEGARNTLVAYGLPTGMPGFVADVQLSAAPELASADGQFYRLGRWGRLWVIGAKPGTSEVKALNVERNLAIEAVFNSTLSLFVAGVWRWSRLGDVLDDYDIAVFDALDLFAHEQRALDPQAAEKEVFGWDEVVDSY
jgi:hypothetical protein